MMDQVIYINGERRMTTELGSRFFVDSDSLPNRFCSQHSLSKFSVNHLNSGGTVFTSGNRYSLKPPLVEVQQNDK